MEILFALVIEHWIIALVILGVVCGFICNSEALNFGGELNGALAFIAVACLGVGFVGFLFWFVKLIWGAV